MRPVCALLLVVAALAPARGAAQIRPLEPLRWADSDGPPREVRAGAAYFAGQRASLAGTRGALVEIGTFALSWRMGRALLEVGGTAVRVFSDDSVYADPVVGTEAPDGERRVDTGDHRVSTVVFLTRPEGRAAAALRFGVRLPTTDNIQGLGRDQTDFFATLAGRWAAGPLAATAEAGIGVFGTRDPVREQVDPLLFAVGLGWGGGPLHLRIEGVGQHDTRRGSALRGNEDLAELRLAAEVGNGRRLRLVLVRGLAEHSPSFGFALESGVRF